MFTSPESLCFSLTWAHSQSLEPLSKTESSKAPGSSDEHSRLRKAVRLHGYPSTFPMSTSLYILFYSFHPEDALWQTVAWVILLTLLLLLHNRIFLKERSHNSQRLAPLLRNSCWRVLLYLDKHLPLHPLYIIPQIWVQRPSCAAFCLLYMSFPIILFVHFISHFVFANLLFFIVNIHSKSW